MLPNKSSTFDTSGIAVLMVSRWWMQEMVSSHGGSNIPVACISHTDAVGASYFGQTHPAHRASQEAATIPKRCIAVAQTEIPPTLDNLPNS